MELGIAVRVRRRQLAQLERGLARVAPEGDPAPVGQGREHARLGLDEAEPAVLQVQVLHDGRAQGSEHVGDGGGLEPGMELLGHGRAAEDVAPLQDDGLETAAREQGRGHEAVVAPADDDDVRLQATFPFFQSLSSSRAEMRPGAPMIPPPGCVAEPHM